MGFKLLKNKILAVQNGGNWKLYKRHETEDGYDLTPIDFAQNIVQIEEKFNLLITANSVWSLGGEHLISDMYSVKLIPIGNVALVVAEKLFQKPFGLKILIWDGKKVLREFECSDFRYSDRYLAIKYGDIWSLYTIDGQTIDEAAFNADEVEICNDLLIVKRLCDQRLYSIKQQDFIKQNQIKIVCSEKHDFALCGQVGKRDLSVYSYGTWYEISDVDDFGIVEGMPNLFYVKKANKYIVYGKNMSRFMKETYPQGVDFIAKTEGRLLIMNDGKAFIY